MNGNDTFLDVNDAHLRVTSGNVYASAFNLDQIDIVMSSNTASTVNFNNPAKAFNAASNIEVGTANLFVDTTTTRVGVGTASPATTLDVAGDLNVSGNLTIIGTTTTLDTDHLRVKDPIIELGKDNTASPVVDLGLVMTRPSGSSNVGIIFDESADTLEIGYTQGSASDSTITMDSAPLSVNVNGTISGNGSGLTALNAANITTGTLDRNTTGSAATLTTPRTIGGVNFDGSADIVPTTFGAATFDTDTLVVDSVNDRVGVGTTSPDSKLDVNGSTRSGYDTNTTSYFGRSAIGYVGHSDWAGFAHIDRNNLGDYSLLQNSSGRTILNCNSTEKISFSSGDSAQMTMLGTGNFGIGTSTPVAKLNIQGTSEGAPPTSGGEGTSNGIFRLRDNFNVALDIGTLGASPWTTWLQVADASSMGGEYPLSLNPNGGNVGIGTTTPRTSLHIGQQLNSQGDKNTIPAAGLGISADFPSSTHAWFANRANATGDEYWGLAVGTIYDGSSYLQNLNKNTGAYYSLLLQPNGGNVGIGTTSPTAKLHIKSSSGGDGIAIVNPAGGTGGLLNSSAGVRGGILISNAGGGSNATDDWSSQPIIFNGGGTGATNGNLRGGSIWSMWGGSQYGLAFKGADNGDSVPEGGTAPNVFITKDKVGIGTADPGYRLEVGVNTSTASHLNVIATQPHVMWKSATAHWQMWNNGTDTNLRFWCLADRAYLQCAGVSDLLNFTGQHRTFIKDVPFSQAGDLEGLIVSSDQNKYIKMSGGIECGTNAITVNESLPVVSVSNVFQDKRCFGVISTSEDPDTRQDKHGNLVSIFDKEGGDTRVYINSVGEGAIWVTDINGPLESGDYITTSNVAGYGMKQDSEFLANYTVAKITMDCDFEPVTQPIQQIKKEMGDVNYWVKTTYKNVSEEEYSNLTEKNRRIVNDIYQRVIKEDTKTEKEDFELEVRRELVNVLDEHGQIQWEDDPSGATEKAYKIRYLDANGVETDEANAVHKAAFVGCTYHCG